MSYVGRLLDAPLQLRLSVGLLTASAALWPNRAHACRNPRDKV